VRSDFKIRLFSGLCVAAWLLALASSEPALADSNRQPVILDTQEGIRDGQSGVVLQNAPLLSEPMVPAESTAAVGEFATPAQPPIIVSPYIAVPGAPSMPSNTSGTMRRARPASVQ
jgi:hypothetical protein